MPQTTQHYPNGQNFRRRCHSPMRRPPPRFFFHRKRILHFGLLFLLLSQTNGQFGEIASVISSLVANGAPAGLAGLGTAGSLGSLGASAGSGAASALSNIGPLYQLAQAALQLTGTGVGIANQASESAWFPVVVENAAKMHRDFQDRLVQGGGIGGVGHETGATKGAIKERTSSKNGDEFGTDYGKEFGSEEKGTSGRGRGAESVDTSSANIFGSHFSLLPPLLPGFGTTSATLLPEGTRRPFLPAGARSLLPGESPLGEFGERTNGGGGHQTMGGRLIGIGSVEEVPLSPPSTEPGQRRVIGIGPSEASIRPTNGRLLPGEIASTNTAKPMDSSTSAEGKGKDSNRLAISSPKITVKLPNYDGEKDGPKSEERGETNSRGGHKQQHKSMDKVETEFSVDNDGLGGRSGGGETADEDSKLEPLIPPEEPSVQRLQRLNMTHIELGNNNEQSEDEGEDGETHAVPKLQKLISQLKTGNLSELDLEELQNQLAENEEPGEPRENTEPTTTTTNSAEDKTEQQQEKRKGSKRIRLPNSKREKASNRNLEAFRKGSEREVDEGETEEDGREEKAENAEGDGVELVDGQRDPILRKIVDFQHPPVILSLERPHPNPSDALIPFLPHSNERSKRRKSNRIDGRGNESETEAADASDHTHQQQRSNEAILSRALGVRSEKVGDGLKSVERKPLTEGTEEVKRMRTKSIGLMGNGETTKNIQQTLTEKFNLRRPQKRKPLALANETDQSEQNSEQQQILLPVVDSMVEKAEMEQKQYQQQFPPPPPFPANNAVFAAPRPPQHLQFPQFQQEQQQIVQFDQQQNLNSNWQGQQQNIPQQQQQTNLLQYPSQQYPQQQNHLQYPQQQNQLQYQQQQNQLQYAQQSQSNQLQYPQQPNQLQYPQHQLQQPQQPNQVQYPQQSNLLQYQQQPNRIRYPQQQNQIQYTEHQKQNSHINLDHLNPSKSLNHLQYPQQLNRPYQQLQKEFVVQNRQFPQQNGAIPFHGRQFGQRQRAVEQPIDQQHNRGQQDDQRMTDGRKVKMPPKNPPAFLPRRVPPPAEGVKKWQQRQPMNNAQRKFPPRTISPSASVLSHQQTTTPSAEVQYPFSSGTLLTLAQPAQNQLRTKHNARNRKK